MHYLKPVFIILEVLALFNLLIFVHELGHFLAARWRGLKIDRFAIWFGKPIWKTKINGVEYALGTIPAGGYVSLPQMAPMDIIEGKNDPGDRPLPRISALDKIIVAFAGPLFSFLLALAFAVVVWCVGRPVSDAENTTTIGFVVKDGPAGLAGLKPGDVIKSVDGHEVTKFSGMGASVTWRIVSSEGTTLPIVVQRGTETKTFEVTPSHEETKVYQRKSLRKIKIGPEQIACIDSLFTNSPAGVAGLRSNDVILQVNGQKIYSPAEVEDLIEEAGTNQARLTVERDGKTMLLTAFPEIPINSPTNRASLGISTWKANVHLVYPGPISQISGSFDAMFSTFGALFDRKSDIKAQHLGGAVKILSVYYLLFQDEDGWRLALWFSVLMNINLAMLNMLPFPVLDGGHILLALIETLRRRAVSARILNYIQTTCAVLLISYMAYIAFFDVQDLIPGGKEKLPEFAPKTQSSAKPQ